MGNVKQCPISRKLKKKEKINKIVENIKEKFLKPDITKRKEEEWMQKFSNSWKKEDV